MWSAPGREKLGPAVKSTAKGLERWWALVLAVGPLPWWGVLVCHGRCSPW